MSISKYAFIQGISVFPRGTFFSERAICAVRYSHQAATFQLFVNEKLAAEGKTLGSIAGICPRIIGSDFSGRRFFYTGSIAELVVYDRLLDQETFEQASNALLEKYRIKATATKITD